MRLGRLIELLQSMPSGASLEFEAVGDGVEGVGDYPSTDFHSWRGSYDQLAFGTGDRPITVGAFLAAARECVGKTFQGYKGGDFLMGEHTPVHVSNKGEASDNRVIGVRGGVSPDYVVYIQVAHVENW